MINQKFIDFTIKNEIIYAVIVNLDTSTIVSTGWKCKLPYEGLLKSLFNEEETVKTVNASLEGQMMPQSMAQGDLACILCKPKSNLLVGLFYIDQREPSESYEYSKQLNNELNFMYL